MKTAVNPFHFESPGRRWDFTDRDELLKAMDRIFHERGRRMLIYGRRRMGKTTLVTNAARLAKVPFLFVDLSTASDLTEVAKKLLRALPDPDEKLLARVIRLAKKHFRGVTIAGAGVKLQGDFRDSEPEANLENVLNFIHERAEMEDICLSVCFDEFQEIRRLSDDRAEWRIRGVIQHHPCLNYLFSGSDHRLLAWMTEPQAAFYKQLELVEVGPISPAHLAGWIDERARTGGVPEPPFGTKVVAAAGPCTGDIVRLAKTVFEFAAAGKKGDALVKSAFEAIALGEMAGQFVSLWRICSQSQRAVLRALAAGKHPQAGATVQEYGLGSPSTAQSAVERLIDLQLLTRDGDALVFDSPFFRHWVAANAVT